MARWVHVLAIVPQNMVSWITGALVRVRWPESLQLKVNAWFVRRFKIDMSEAELALEQYATIEDVFTRRLRPGSRTIAEPLCSPADGTLSRSVTADNNTAVQAKGITYRLDELVFGQEAAVELSGYSTIYLAPHNYHRVHAPVAGTLVGMRYFPGELWPVNRAAVQEIPNLFVRNERLVFDIKTAQGMVYVVMVGALNVGRMQAVAAPDFFSNDFPDRLQSKKGPIDVSFRPCVVKCGDELGTFMLGSTVVVVYEKSFYSQHNFVQTMENTPIMMGNSLLHV